MDKRIWFGLLVLFLVGFVSAETNWALSENGGVAETWLGGYSQIYLVGGATEYVNDGDDATYYGCHGTRYGIGSYCEYNVTVELSEPRDIDRIEFVESLTGYKVPIYERFEVRVDGIWESVEIDILENLEWLVFENTEEDDWSGVEAVRYSTKFWGNGQHGSSYGYNVGQFYELRAWGGDVNCYEDLDCGENVSVGVGYCVGGDVYQNYTVPVCEGAGTCDSYCSSHEVLRLEQNCSFGCLEGSCINESGDDGDGDGYGRDEDCNDSDALINPGAEEICGNGVDEDCSSEDLDCVDLEAPGAVSGLRVVSVGRTSISWNWSNPDDADFSLALIYFDGVNVLNSSDNFYEVGGLEEGSLYVVEIFTMDEAGNVNWEGVLDEVFTNEKGGSAKKRIVLNRDDDRDEVSVNYYASSDELVDAGFVGDGSIYLSEDVEDSDEIGLSVFWVVILILGIVLLLILIGLVVLL